VLGRRPDEPARVGEEIAQIGAMRRIGMETLEQAGRNQWQDVCLELFGDSARPAASSRSRRCAGPPTAARSAGIAYIDTCTPDMDTRHRHSALGTRSSDRARSRLTVVVSRRSSRRAVTRVYQVRSSSPARQRSRSGSGSRPCLSAAAHRHVAMMMA